MSKRARYWSRNCHEQDTNLPSFSPLASPSDDSNLAGTRNPTAPSSHRDVLQSRCAVIVRSGSGDLLLSRRMTLPLLATSRTDAHLRGGSLPDTLLLLLSQRSIGLQLLGLGLCLGSLLLCGMLLEGLGLGVVTWGLRLGEIDIRRRLGHFLLRLDEAALQRDDVVAQAVVFVLEGLVVFAQVGVIAHLGFEAFDVAFFTLTEGALFLGGRG